ncbi:MAG TPA: CpsB/CapC family capsule biosynthesis tyrosine phosphatase [Lacipirellulaceae bacterium]|nr:CpsB/CapC family capsule biosynthesis tyrosine phosphatase [Lacipirellulaceae bacterium]
MERARYTSPAFLLLIANLLSANYSHAYGRRPTIEPLARRLALAYRARVMTISFTDIHCHLVPAIDDGAADWDESLAMARLAASDGIGTVIATPHQLGSFGHNRGDDIRHRVADLQQRLNQAGVRLNVLPGADVRIEPSMIDGLRTGDVLTIGDHRRHVLLELPHDLYLPLDPIIDELHRHGMVGVLSHPERNQGILRCPEIIAPLVDRGCLMQVTAGSVCGTFGPLCEQLSNWLLAEGLVHFVATDAHGSRARRPMLRRAFQRVIELTGEELAVEFCCENPAAVAAGKDVQPGRRAPVRRKRKWFATKLGV